MANSQTKNNVFTEWALRYFELGYNVLPIGGNGKIPVIKDWSKWSHVRQSEEQILEWIEAFKVNPKIGIGIPLGDFGGLAIDIDDDSILDLAPRSPYAKKGGKGLTYFFKPNRFIKLAHLPAGTADILSYGSQTVIPPSFYKGGPQAYTWLNESLPPIDELPELDLSTFDKFEKTIRSKFQSLELINKPGRNNELTNIAYMYASQGLSDIDAAERLIEHDKRKNPTNPYFSDENEFKTNDEIINALSFFERAKRASEKRGDRIKQIEIVIDEKPSKEPEEDFVNLSSLIKDYQALIDSGGYIIKSFADYCRELGNVERPGIYLAGGLSLCALLASNNVRFGNTWPNLYILTLAKTGDGKSIPQIILDRILVESDNIHFKGPGDYRSPEAVISGFNNQKKHTRLDVQDEIGQLFLKMNTRESMGHIVDYLSGIFSASNTVYAGGSFSNSKNNIPAITNPCLTWCSFTTPSGVKGKLSEDFLLKGLGSRMIYLLGGGPSGKINQEMGVFSADVKLDEAFIGVVRYWLDLPPRVTNSSGPVNYAKPLAQSIDPIDLTPTKEAADYLKSIENAVINKLSTNKVSDVDSFFSDDTSAIKTALSVRKAELIKRIAISHWMSSNGDFCEVASFELGLQSILWAEKFINCHIRLTTAMAPHMLAVHMGYDGSLELEAKAIQWFELQEPSSVIPYWRWAQFFERSVNSLQRKGARFPNLIALRDRIESTIKVLKLANMVQVRGGMAIEIKPNVNV